MLHKLFRFFGREVLFSLDVGDASIKRTFQEYRHQVLAMTEDVVATSTDDDAILLPYHVSQGTQWLLGEKMMTFTIRRHSEEQLIDWTLIEESLHLVDNPSLTSHFEQTFTGIEGNAIMFSQQPSHVDGTTAALACNRNNHKSITFNMLSNQRFLQKHKCLNKQKS